METILDWSWPYEPKFRFYIVQLFFWSGYAILTGLIGTCPYYFTRYRQTAWTTFVLGAMGTLMAYLSQFLFKLDEPLDMISPYAIGVSIVATVFLAPILSLFVFVCRPEDDLTYLPDGEYQEGGYLSDPRYDDEPYGEYGENGRGYPRIYSQKGRVSRRARRRR